jgi:hypothetical protein
MQIKNEEQEALDGCYVLITREYEKTASEIIEIYRGLLKIEEPFKVTKSDLETDLYSSQLNHI